MKTTDMKRVLCVILLWVVSSITNLQAHPGIGLVYDGDQTIYYTDLTQVWKLNIETGATEVFVKDVHTHELYLDHEGNLYGEHYWYIESEQKFKNFIWRVNKRGEFTKIRSDQYGENEDFSFIRDDSFHSFELRQQNDVYQIIKKDTAQEYILHTAKLNQPTWKYLSNDENLLFVDYPSIYLANRDTLQLISSDVSSKRIPFSMQSDHHNIYGIWTDADENIYAAIYGGRVVKKIDKEGKTKRIVKSSFLWSPVNGIFDKEDNLWLMEARIGGSVRVRKISKSELDQRTSFTLENILILGSLVLLIALVIRLLNIFKNG